MSRRSETPACRLPLPANLLGLPMDAWVAAAAGEAKAHAAAFDALLAQAGSLEEGGFSGTAQDLAKGRPTEVDHVNGLVAREGKRLGIDVTVNASVADMIRRAESGAIATGPDALRELAGGRTHAG
jgi:2-dehydropantoate 2-reductase